MSLIPEYTSYPSWLLGSEYSSSPSHELALRCVQGQEVLEENTAVTNDTNSSLLLCVHVCKLQGGWVGKAFNSAL